MSIGVIAAVVVASGFVLAFFGYAFFSRTKLRAAFNRLTIEQQSGMIAGGIIFGCVLIGFLVVLGMLIASAYGRA